MIDQLHYISQQPENGSHLTAIKQALEAGCKWIQLRVKNTPNHIVLKYAIESNELCKNFDARLIINDYPEIALSSGAYGVHLGLQDMSIKEARKIVGSKMVIGGTANTFEHIRQRAAEGADYIGLGPFRFTPTKKNLSPLLGLSGYQSILEQVQFANIGVPIIAIGGLVLEDIIPLMQVGVYGVAVSAALTTASNRSEIVKEAYQQLNAVYPASIV